MTFDYSKIHFNHQLLLKEMEKRGIQLSFLPFTDLVEAKLGEHIEYIHEMTTRLVPHLYAHVLEDKFYSKLLLDKNQVSISPGIVFAHNDLQKAKQFASEAIKFPVVIKPTTASSGSFVFANIQNEKEFSQAFLEIGRTIFQPIILVEKFFTDSHDYRFFLTQHIDRPFVIRRTPPKITGDGKSTIKELIEAENYTRMNPRKNCLCEIYIDDNEGQRCLKNQQLTTDSIPQNGEIIQLRYNANVSWGGECENVQNEVHPTFFELTKKIFNLFPALPFIFIDLLIRDCTKPATADNYNCCELHVLRPGLSLFLYPSKGESQDIVAPIIDLLFPETAKNYDR